MAKVRVTVKVAIKTTVKRRVVVRKSAVTGYVTYIRDRRKFCVNDKN